MSVAASAGAELSSRRESLRPRHLAERLLGRIEDPCDLRLADRRGQEPVVMRVEIHPVRDAGRREGAAPLEGSLVGDEGHEGNGRGAAGSHLETVRGGLPLQAAA